VEGGASNKVVGDMAILATADTHPALQVLVQRLKPKQPKDQFKVALAIKGGDAWVRGSQHSVGTNRCGLR